MPISKRVVAATELVLILPAALFLTAVVARHLGPLRHGVAQTAEWIVRWYSGRYWTLWVALIGLPLVALSTGCVALRRTWNDDTELRSASPQASPRRWRLATLAIAAATLAAGLILVIVVLHMLAT